MAEIPSPIVLRSLTVPTARDRSSSSSLLRHLVPAIQRRLSRHVFLVGRRRDSLVAHGTCVLHVEPLAEAGSMEEVAAGGDHGHLHVLRAGRDCHPVGRGTPGSAGQGRGLTWKQMAQTSLWLRSCPPVARGKELIFLAASRRSRKLLQPERARSQTLK